MHCLDVIIAGNEQATTDQSPCVAEYGWQIQHDGHGHIVVSGHGHHVVVDCSNPLLDRDLVTFHRQYATVMPKWVRRNVESIASQYRRLIINTPHWAECQREAKAA